MRTFDVEEILDLDANYVCVDGKRKVKLRENYNGTYRAIQLTGCSLGDYFAILAYLLDRGIDAR